ncbi:MAG: hypothetical protein WCQ72_01640 [Eubacteriales bacterium]
MALPMVHLAAAYLWHPEDTALHECPEYYLGAIAPDAIHAREGVTREDKRVTHFGGTGCADCLQRISRLWLRDSSPFAIGYGLHIITDRVWAENYRQFKGLFDPQTGKIRSEVYYGDTDAVDFMLYDSLPYRPFLWDKLSCAVPRDFEGLLSAAEIGWWQQRVLHWFENRNNERSGEIKYLTYDVISRFIAESSALCDAKLASDGVENPTAERVK